MASDYPGALDTFSNPTSSTPMNDGTTPHAAQHADANDAIEAIQATLGVDPQGSESTVADRLDAIEAGGGGGGGGLVLLHVETLSGVTGVNVDGVFDGTYDDYLIVAQLDASGSDEPRFRFRASGTNETGSVYSETGFYYQGHGPYGTNVNLDGSDHGSLQYITNGGTSCYRLDIMGPHLARNTNGHGTYDYWSGGHWTFGPMSLCAASSTQYDGFCIYTAGGSVTLTGTVRVYGYAKS